MHPRLIAPFLVSILTGLLPAQPIDATQWAVIENTDGNPVETTVESFEGRDTLALPANQRAFFAGDLPDNFRLEVDIHAAGMPGIGFRAQDRFNYDYVFFRTRGTDSADNAIQYLPVFNGATAWHLYAHHQAAAKVASETWFHVTLDVRGDACRVSIDGEPHFSFHLDPDRARTGSLFLRSSFGAARFANLRIGPPVEFAVPSIAPLPANYLTNWELSPPAELTPTSPIGAIGGELRRLVGQPWQPAKADDHGLVNLAKYFAHPQGGAFARTTIHSDSARKALLKFDYTHWLTVFLNNQIVFSGRELDTGNSYRVVDGEETLPLDLREGANELIVLSFGYDLSHNQTVLGRHQYENWGFIARLDDAPIAPAVTVVPALAWQVSGPVPAPRVDISQYPSGFALFGLPWEVHAAEPTGHIGVPSAANSVRFARTDIFASQPYVARVDFAATGRWHAFLNRESLASDETGTTGRSLALALNAGWNELFLAVDASAEDASFSLHTEHPVEPLPTALDRLTKVWELDGFNVPESVIHDPARGVLYVSNYAQTGDPPSGSVSRISLDGTMLDQNWVTGLASPTGLVLHADRLYVVERSTVAVIDPDTARIERRIALPAGTFYNDIIVDDAGTLYVSDSSTNSDAQDVLRLNGDTFTPLVTGPVLHRTNGLHWHGGHLIAGSTGIAQLVRVHPATGDVTPIANLAGGILDGIRTGPDDTLLVSQWRGRIFSIAADGRPTLLLDSPGSGLNTADFEYVAAERLLIVPTFFGNKVVAYRLSE